MASRADAPDGVQVAASIVVGLRHLLIDRGLWEAIRSALVAREPSAVDWIETELAVDPTRTEWVSAAHYGELMDAILEVVGAEGTFDLGRERLHRSAQAGAFAPVLRSWARSFGDSPEEFLRLTTHAWSGQTKNFGVLEPKENRPGYARFLVHDPAPVVRDSQGCQQFLSGYGTGLLDVIQRTGRCTLRADPTGKLVEIVYEYDPTASGPAGPAAA